VTAPRVVRASYDDAPRLAATLGDGFQDDPLLAFILPDPGTRPALAPLHFLPIVRWAARTGVVWRTDDDAAVACWLPPGRRDPTPEAARASGLDRMGDDIGHDAVARADVVFGHLAARRVALGVPDHWHLGLLGVRRDSQGRGLGGAVVAPGLAAADAAGEWCFLETTAARNVPFYERHGFETIEAGVEPVSGVPYWLFLRRPS
jgi:GNAT superfamily N-acetyltransferase